MAKNRQTNKPPEPFVFVYKKIVAPLSKFLVRRMYDDPEGAQEVYAETVMAAWIGWQTFERKSSYITWIFRIALNKMADYYRDQVNQRSHIIAPSLENLANIRSNELSPEEKMILLELRNSVKKCIQMLPPEKQKLLYLRYWEDMTVKKIALALGMSERSVEGKLYRARQDLKMLLNYSLK